MLLVSCSELTKGKVTTLVKLQSSKSLHQIEHHAGLLHYTENKQTLALTDCFLSSWTVYITAEPSWIWRLDTRMISHPNEDAMEQKGSAHTRTHLFFLSSSHTVAHSSRNWSRSCVILSRSWCVEHFLLFAVHHVQSEPPAHIPCYALLLSSYMNLLSIGKQQYDSH